MNTISIQRQNVIEAYIKHPDMHANQYGDNSYLVEIKNSPEALKISFKKNSAEVENISIYS